MSATPSRRPPPPPAHVATTPGAPADELARLRGRLAVEARARGEVSRSSLPTAVATTEALAVADFVERRWAPARDDAGRLLPGLVSCGEHLSREVAAELRALVTLATEARAATARARRTTVAPRLERATTLLRELRAAAAWLRDVGGVPQVAAALARSQRSGLPAGRSGDGVAASLDAAVEAMAPHAGALEGVGGFRLAVLAEAREAAVALRGRAEERAEARAEALGDVYLAMIAERVGRVRAAARFVFRAHPDVVREATSAWERAKRRRRGVG